MSDTTNAEPATCGLCGKPVKGYASIGNVRYCHGDPDVTLEQIMHELKYGAPPTCYEQANGQPGPLAQQWLRGEVHTGGVMSDLGWLDRVRLRRYARRVGRDPEVQAWAAEQRKLVAEGFYRNDSLGSEDAAMSDTPDVLDAIARAVNAWNRTGDLGSALDALTTAGIACVYGDGLQHGDELVPEMLLSGGPTGRYWVRRSVPENGDT